MKFGHILRLDLIFSHYFYQDSTSNLRLGATVLEPAAPALIQKRLISLAEKLNEVWRIKWLHPAFNLCGQPVPPGKRWSQQAGHRLSVKDRNLSTQPHSWDLGHANWATQGDYRDVKSHALCTWEEGFFSQFESKAKEPPSSPPKPLTLQHLQIADPDLPTAGQSHHTRSTSEAKVRNSCQGQQLWSTHTCCCRDLTQCIWCLALLLYSHPSVLYLGNQLISSTCSQTAPLLYKRLMEPWYLTHYQFKRKDKITHFHLLSFCASSGTISFH